MASDTDLTRIKVAIAASGKFHKDLAEAIGMTPSSFSRCLTGKRSFGSSALILLLRELNLDPEALRKKAS